MTPINLPALTQHLTKNLVRRALAGITTLAITLTSQGALAQSVGSGYLDLGGQVAGPSTSPTLGSIYDVSGNDELRWTTYFQSRLGNPLVADGVQTLPTAHTWMNGRVLMPPRTTMTWTVGGTDTTTEPAQGTAVTQVKWTFSPMKTITGGNLSTTVDFTGTGDGYRIIPYKNNLYVVNHHIYSGYLNCRVASTGKVCPGFPSGGTGLSFYGTTGQLLDATNSQYYTNMNPMEALNYATGELFVSVADTSTNNVYVVCTDLNTLKSCGSWLLGNSAPAGENQANLEFIGNRYFAILANGSMKCFDVALKQLCGSYQYPAFSAATAIDSRTFGVTSIQLNGKLFFNNSYKFWCHDPVTNMPCTGWTSAGIANSSYAGITNGAFPVLNSDGSPRGVCNTTSETCLTLLGVRFTPSTNFVNYLNANSFVSRGWRGNAVFVLNAGAVYGTKIYTGGSDGYGISCFDFASDNVCTNYPIRTSEFLAGYTTRMDPTRPGCVLHLGDLVNGTAIGILSDALTGGSCTDGGDMAQPLNIDVNPPDYYRCDPTRARVTAWDQVRISKSVSWGTTGGINSVQVTIRDASGNLLPTAMNPVRQFASGAYSLDISDIPYKDYPRLQIEVKFGSLYNKVTIQNALGVDVTWKGDPYQVCVQTKVPTAPYCETAAGVTVTTRLAEDAATTVRERMTIDRVMTPGAGQIGFGAQVASTTTRALLGNLPTGEQKTYVLQARHDMKAYTGDLWAFDLTSQGGINTSGLLKGSSVLLAPASRLFYLAKPDTSTTSIGVGAMTVAPMAWANATTSQQTALNTTLGGQRDTKGSARLDYLRGTDGSLRARAGAMLGPVVNSGPSVLPPRALAGLSEANHPGYTLYRQNTSRSYPLALYGGADGGLHAFEVRAGSLREAWTLVPDVMLRQATRFSDPSLNDIRRNPYFVDNVPMVGHANTGSDGAPDWRAIAVLTYGRGARAITAVDVTKSDLAGGKGVLFEYTPETRADSSDTGDLRDLGYIVGQPVWNETIGSQQIVKMADGRWAVLVGNGINSNDSTDPASAGPGRAVLYAFYLDSAKPRWRRWAVDALFADASKEPGLVNNNGLSTPRPVDTNGDGRVDVVYAGDIQGNLWRFDVKNTASATVTRLFQTAAGQPIYQAPLATRHLGTGACTATEQALCWQVVFGTGAYLSPLQGTTNSTTQALYGVLDKGTGAQVTAGQLVTQTFASVSGSSGVEFRLTSGTSIDYAGGKRGWTMLLGTDEHLVAPLRLQPTGQVMLPVVKPITAGASATSCLAARSWLFEFHPVVGATNVDTFDTNGDAVVDSKDRLVGGGVTTPRPASAMSIAGMLFSAPTVLRDSSNAADSIGLLLPSLGQVASGDGKSYATKGVTTTSTNGSGSEIVKHGDHKLLGRITWREVF